MGDYDSFFAKEGEKIGPALVMRKPWWHAEVDSVANYERSHKLLAQLGIRIAGGCKLTIQFVPGGLSRFGGDEWVAKIDPPIGSKCGWHTETFEGLIQAIAEDLP